MSGKGERYERYKQTGKQMLPCYGRDLHTQFAALSVKGKGPGVG